ncbi:protein-glutamate O-methyltransferase CheR [Chitiniphilus purpureus]|uniref:Chemotaxis protein methyltransferase n=1 Tax=Chitiniphilus purpureus TaxID=2981137 RepID=A0ABY6DI96_9NEIS|nr:protein-glutamate O-methyltransferase CheR [Chitiniphilus sp. CD1]UXY13953.1 protein-glutamate O-methyltransferase CheR [Chitiniphilus sp. CD1]
MIAVPAPFREFTFSDADFQQVRQLIHAHAGIFLGEHKRAMVYARLGRRLRALHLRSFADYLTRLTLDGAEWEHFTNALTTNLTRFFREPHHFVLLQRYLAQLQGREARIWSAGCASGEEAYSIAITAAQSGRPARVLATDLDTAVLARARQGIYPIERVEELALSIRRRYFHRGRGPHQGMAAVKPELAARVAFRQLNLRLSPWPMSRPFDVVFCRNVLIYFDRPTQQDILRRITTLLAPGGLLFLGHSETVNGAGLPLELVDTTTYRLCTGSDAS